MGKQIKYKRQVLRVDMSYELAFGGYVLDAEILWYSKRITHITMYTKDALSISFKNCRLFEPLQVNEKMIFPTDFDTALLYPTAGSDCGNYQEVNIPIQNGSRIKGRFINPDNALELIIVLQLETS